MAEILIVYSTQEGQTAKIANRMADRIESAGHRARLHQLSVAGPQPPDPAGFDGVLVGASVHAGHHAAEVAPWLAKVCGALASRPSALFSVSLSAGLPAVGGADQARSYLRELAEQSGWRPEQAEVFGGAVRNSRYGLLKRMLMCGILSRSGAGSFDSARDYEFTDWEAVDAFVDALLARLSPT
jgi:menaquinone-dependent protoporphyrinogen oxidase